jgi:methylated-DNA-[protein]-cysteine S-methyltransferase
MIYDIFDSPLGQMRLCCNGTHLTAVTFVGQKYEDKHIPKDAVYGTHPVLEQTKEWLSQYFDGKIPDFLPPTKPMGTPFQKKVWDMLLQIPYGETITYGELAKRLNCKSAQAVGGAVGKNPISILIPCHRVVGSNGTLTGYAGGVEKKEILLKLEKDHLN